MSERVLVTGGAGFIGSHLVEVLLNAGFEVAVIDNLSTGKYENVNPQAHFYKVDIRDVIALDRIFSMERPVFVCHQAARADVRGSISDPTEYASVNIIGTIRLLEAAWKYGVRKMTFASTGGAIYGNVTPLPVTEKSDPHPLDPYGVSKLSGEHYLFSCRHNHGLDYCALRYGNVYGPRQDPYGEAGVVAIFTGKMLHNQQAVINGDGCQTRDFVYVGDVARANLLALQYGSGIYNVGTGIPTDINTIFRHLAELTGYSLSAVYGSAKPGEVPAIALDASRARRELLWRPTVSLGEGLAKTVESFRAPHRFTWLERATATTLP